MSDIIKSVMQIKMMLRFSITLVFLALGTTINIGEVRAEVISGDCGKQGDNVVWEYDSDLKTLTISGNGDMKDCGEYDNIFYDYLSSPYPSVDT